MRLTFLALRNLSREPKRTANRIIGQALVCCVLIIWSSLAGGFSETIYETATALVLGDAQIHHRDYTRSESIYDRIPFDESHAGKLATLGYAAAPRLYAYALAAQSEGSQGIKIIGVNPAQEARVTRIHGHLGSGTWLAGHPTEVVLGYQLARTLKLGLGQQIVLLGQAADGSLTNGLFTIAGILKPLSASVDQRAVYMNAPDFRELFAVADGVHELVLKALPPATTTPESKASADATTTTTTQRTGFAPGANLDLTPVHAAYPTADVRSWRELKPDLAAILDLLSYTIYFTLTFIYIALGNLLLNIKLMTVLDRTREYGVMRALGMLEVQVVYLVLAEALWLGLFSAVLAAVVAVPIASYLEIYGLDFRFYLDRFAYSGFMLEPILYAKLGLKQVLAPTLFLVIMLPLAALYPAIIAARTSPSAAISGGRNT